MYATGDRGGTRLQQERSPSWRLARKALRQWRLTVIYDFLPHPPNRKERQARPGGRHPAQGPLRSGRAPPPSRLPDSLQPSLALRCPPGAAGPLLPARPAARPLPICRGEQRESAGERGARPPPAQPWRGQSFRSARCEGPLSALDRVCGMRR